MNQLAHLMAVMARAERRLRDAADTLHACGYTVSARATLATADELAEQLRMLAQADATTPSPTSPPAVVDLSDTAEFAAASRPMAL